jgi:hypothetical protein
LFVPLLATLGLFGILMVGLGCVAGIVFLSLLQMTLGRCSPRNRTMAPAAVWLCLIPIFGVFWMIRVVNAVGDSLRAEFVDRKIDQGGVYAKALGRWWLAVSILGVGIIVAANAFHSLKAGALAFDLLSIVWLVLFVLYWLRVAGFSKRLQQDIARDDDLEFEHRLSRLRGQPDERIR